MFGIIRNVLYEEVLSVKLPRTLTLQNKRLGMLLKMLQICFLALAVLYCWDRRLWRTDVPMKPWLPSISTDGAAYHLHTKQCADTRRLNGTSRTCRSVHEHAAHARSTDAGFVPTSISISETDYWEGNGDACTATATKQWCQDSVPAGVFQNDVAGQCSCQRSERSDVPNPEDERFQFFHGYRADVKGIFGDIDTVFGSSALTADLRTSGNDWHQVPGELSTIFQSPTGSRCVIGGRSEWSRVDASNGVSGTLGELLACAGVNLDMDPRQLTGGLPFQVWKTVRDMGLSLEFVLDYERTAHFSARPHKCFVTVMPGPSLSSRESSGWDGSTLRTNTVRGVTLTAHIRTGYQVFDLSTFVENVVNVLVILRLPQVVVQFIALYCLGIVSKIYRGLHSAKINIFSQLHSYVSRHLLAVAGFRGLVGQWEGRVSALPSLTRKQLQNYLEDVFAEEFDKQILNPEDLRRMVNVVFLQLDSDDSGGIGFREFVHACNKQDDCELETLAHFFRKDKPHKGPNRVRRLLDSTHKRLGKFSVYNKWSYEPSIISTWSFKSNFSKGSLSEVKPPPEPKVDCKLVALEEQHLALAEEVNTRLAAMESQVCKELTACRLHIEKLQAKLLGETEPRGVAEATPQGELGSDVEELSAAGNGLVVPETELLDVYNQREPKMPPPGATLERHALHEEPALVAPAGAEVVVEDAGREQAGRETNSDASCPSVILPEAAPRASACAGGPLRVHSVGSLRLAVHKFSGSLLHPSDPAVKQESGSISGIPATATATTERSGTGKDLVVQSTATRKRRTWPLTVEPSDVMERVSVDATFHATPSIILDAV